MASEFNGIVVDPSNGTAVGFAVFGIVNGSFFPLVVSGVFEVLHNSESQSGHVTQAGVGIFGIGFGFSGFGVVGLFEPHGFSEIAVAYFFNFYTSVPFSGNPNAQNSIGIVLHLRLPHFIARLSVGRRRFKGVILRMKPILGRIERLVRPRMLWMFSRRNERLVGAVLFAVACALFIPLPGSGFIPATALLISSVGLVERDGVVLAGGLVLGAASIVVTIAVAGAVIAGLGALGGV